ncbi:membrane protein [Leptolyngbya sp. Heron Island J]|uniref:DUF4184 family protein n=1 Tax=Leptolyngbya sp. Heron Island J TaxID=1385935 RepID=UPI0003B9D6A3|nr:DUF4184 family protein [Leptolyngbya sp. Heron Island J]ESA33122.1 membrane protein [Leptolyngbya sp. Heron Island J]
MPFTPAHIVAVLPFWPLRRVVPFSAFAIGAMIPDLPLFFPIVDYTQAHSTSGLFSLCLPLGMGGFFLFELVMRKPMIALLPAWLESRLSFKPYIPSLPFVRTQLCYVIAVAFAILVGAYTHQIWDAFTHKGRWGTYLIPSLNADIEISGFHVPGYQAFQYGSAFLGLPLLVMLAAIALNRTPPTLQQKTLHSKLKILAGALMVIVPICVAVHAYIVSPDAHQLLFLTITRSGAILMVMLLAYCLLFNAFADRNSSA